MARPKLGKGDSQRLQMVITDEEVQVIDAWQHSRHVPSRSDAIRRLCQIGLVVEAMLNQISAEGAEIVDGAYDDLAYADEAASALGEGKITPDMLPGIVREMQMMADRMHSAVAIQQARLDALTSAIMPLTSPGNIGRATEEAASRLVTAIAEANNRKAEWYSQSSANNLARHLASMSEERRAAYDAMSTEEQNEYWNNLARKRAMEWAQRRDEIQSERANGGRTK